MHLFTKIQGFEWDIGNINKNYALHDVSNAEAEQLFFNEPLIIDIDLAHSSEVEQRYRALGKTDDGRCLFVVFTLRSELIRIISVRDMSKKERKVYNEKT